MFEAQFIEKLAEELAPRLAEVLAQRLQPAPLPQQEWFSRKQAAHYIGATSEGFRSMLRDGMFPVHAYKGRERIRRADIDKLWLENRQYLKP